MNSKGKYITSLALQEPNQNNSSCEIQNRTEFVVLQELQNIPETEADHDQHTEVDANTASNNDHTENEEVWDYDSDKDPEFNIAREDFLNNNSGSDDSYENLVPESIESPDLQNSSQEKTIRKGRPVRGRKRKHLNIRRQDNKIKRNSNELHYNYKGETIEKRKFDNTFQCSCVRKCHSIISEETRREQFNKYWELANYDAQTAFLGSLIREEKKKRVYGRGIRNKEFSRKYYLSNTEVCRETFIKTLRISTKRVNTALTKLRSSTILDQRGKIQGGKNKIDEVRKHEVIRQINKIPKYISHYRREQSSQAQFLPPEMSLALMYKMYKIKVEKPISFASYKRIFFSEFNVKFKPLKKDTCNTCDMYAAQIQSCQNEEEKEKKQNDHNDHIHTRQAARQKMKEDMKIAAECNWYECITFDLEKTLPLPRIPTGILFYKRQFWPYNLGIHSGSLNKGYFYIWIESEAGRGAQEIGSCLLKHISENVPSDTTELVMWSDSCGGQNRYIKLTLLMKTALQVHESLRKIYTRFLVSGHTFLPNDSDFSDVECSLKRQQRLYTPEDYITVMQECRRKNKFKITRMKASEFYGTSKLEGKITNRKLDINKEKISWLQTREVMLDKSKPFSIFMKSNFSSLTYTEVDIRKKQVGRPIANIFYKEFLTHMWLQGKKISVPKLQDIQSVMHLIPTDCQLFYTNLHGDNDIMDDLDGFTGSPDFENE